MPAITLHGDGEDWFPQKDLLASDRFAPEFVAEMEDDGTATLRFGDGTLGRKPAPGARFSASYRVGAGTAGNVGAETLARVVTNEAAITRVRNPLPASGGNEPEPTEQVRLYAPQAFRRQERAITEADYVAVAQRHPEVNRAAASLRWTGSWHTMFLTVDRKSGAAVDRRFRQELTSFLERFRLAGYDLEVDTPRFVALDIVLTVCVEPNYLRAHVERALLDAFGTGDLGNGRQGFFHPGHFSFGDPVYLSQVIATAMQKPGVQWIDSDDRDGKPNRFRRWGEESHGEIASGMIRLDRLEIARVQNDPNSPENGRIKFLMQGGL
jgi:predicted phage baseplate assembly protein